MVLSKRCMVFVLVCVMFDGGSARSFLQKVSKELCQQQQERVVNKTKQSRGFQKKTVTSGEESEERRKIGFRELSEEEEQPGCSATNDLSLLACLCCAH